MKRLAVLVLSFLLLVVGSANAESAEGTLMSLYAEGELLMVQGKYMEAATKFEALGTYSDSSQMAMYCKAIAIAETNGMYPVAVAAFTMLGDFKDSAQMVIYYSARSKQQAGAVDLATASDDELSSAIRDNQEAVNLYSSIILFKDSLSRSTACTDMISSISAEQNRRITEADETLYQQARSFMECEDYDAAYSVFLDIKGYKDVDNLLATDDNLKAAAAARYARFTVGKYVTFGSYPQTAAGKDDTPIEWLVLARDGNRALLISRYALDCQRYNRTRSYVTWDMCTLRTWLNSTFLNKAFDAQEQSAILTTRVTPDAHPSFSSNIGNETRDKVFLLSVVEAERYFASETARQCRPTAYAVKQGADDFPYGFGYGGAELSGNCEWWLRQPSDGLYGAPTVCPNGSFRGQVVNMSNFSIRPAIWIDLDSSIFWFE
ncbi:MAG: hypothetical protein IJE07_06715 [Clostridia bacterium]|nr:hypothetical protein [Clostridia bacterium]